MNKNIFLFILLTIFITDIINSQSFYSSPFASTYSIVARDPVTGDMGVAVQSHWFSVGTIVTWGEAGVGVIATQSFVNVSFGPRGLSMLKSGLSAQEVLDSLIQSDPGRDLRQLAILDSKGNVAAYTGKNCIPDAGHIVGKDFSVQANLMKNDKVWGAMEEAFVNSEGELADRLITALEAAEYAGGDIRGKQSAAVLVVKGQSTGELWNDVLVDIRIDDNPNPLKELRRTYNVHLAYEHMNAGDLAIEYGDMTKALEEYSMAQNMFPENEEMKYWTAVTLANNNRMDEATKLFKLVFEKKS
jgi:uncharacterized Ntn-hydrolase superfamily protein